MKLFAGALQKCVKALRHQHAIKEFRLSPTALCSHMCLALEVIGRELVEDQLTRSMRHGVQGHIIALSQHVSAHLVKTRG
mmetsp:Transcript_29661/g.52417  ORF Transcript_29661/g.52417 Transcript_29661/m.52417 type:complete len:80 (+) Transcript_29661:46-285(+)